MPFYTQNIVTANGEQVSSLLAGANVTLTNEGSGVSIASSGGGGGGGGAVTLVSSQMVSDVAQVVFNFSAGYNYFIVGNDLTWSTSAEIYAQFGNGTSVAPAWIVSSNYIWGVTTYFGTNGNSTSDTKMTISNRGDNGGPLNITVSGNVGNSDLFMINSQYQPFATSSFGSLNEEVSVTQMKLFLSAGSISGNFYLYSVEQ
jgi:hypothetical protein